VRSWGLPKWSICRERKSPMTAGATTEGTSLRVRHFDGTETDTAEWTHRNALPPHCPMPHLSANAYFKASLTGATCISVFGSTATCAGAFAVLHHKAKAGTTPPTKPNKTGIANPAPKLSPAAKTKLLI
jgi:hypothetical protein